MDIILSAGHNRRRPGASALDGILLEHELNNNYARALEMALVKLGASVEYIPQELNLSARVTRLRALKDRFPRAIAIELHFNVFNSRAHGAEVFYASGDKLSFDVMSPVLRNTCERLRQTCRGMKLPSASARGKLGWCSSGGVLWEVAFMDNPTDLQKVTPVRLWAEVVAEELYASVIRSGCRCSESQD
jgi:N-acetylmuramoyl-L-alanine amidase